MGKLGGWTKTYYTGTEFITLKTPEETIPIGFTEQKVSGRARLLDFTGFLPWHGFKKLLARLMPQRTSPNAIPSEDLALGFVTGVLGGAQKLTHVAHLRQDAMLPTLPGIKRIGSQSSYTRFIQRFAAAGTNLEIFRPLWRWGIERLASRPGGYSLDLDSTRLLHEAGHQEGVAPGHTRLGNKPCLHPLLAVLEVIKQLDMDFALPKWCLAKFWATEAALSSAVLSYNLTQIFQRHLGWLQRVTASTLRFRLFTTGGIPYSTIL